MLDLTLPSFGKAINFENTPKAEAENRQQRAQGSSPTNQMGANAMVSQFVNMKRNYREDLQLLTGSDSHALRHFCGDDCAFIFDVKFMKTIVETIEKNQETDEHGHGKGGCMVLFQGLRKDKMEIEQKDADGEEKTICVFGRPTLIAAAYVWEGNHLCHKQVDEDAAKNNMLENVSGRADGFEHPGDGNSKAAKIFFEKFALGNTNEQDPKEFIPRVLDAGGDDDDTDFKIRTTLTDDRLKGWVSEGTAKQPAQH